MRLPAAISAAGPRAGRAGLSATGVPPAARLRAHPRRAGRRRGYRRDRPRPLRRCPNTTSPPPRPRLHLDSRLLGLGTRRLLLGPRRVDPAALLWRALDASLLGLLRRLLRLPPRLLGTPRRLLRWHRLWLRLYRHRLLRWVLEPQPLLLQPRGDPCRPRHSQ